MSDKKFSHDSEAIATVADAIRIADGRGPWGSDNFPGGDVERARQYLGALDLLLDSRAPNKTEVSSLPSLDRLRTAGWFVASHNDYVLNGERFTFWLLTHPGLGIFVRGEGRTDAEALEAAETSSKYRPSILLPLPKWMATPILAGKEEP